MLGVIRDYNNYGNVEMIINNSLISPVYWFNFFIVIVHIADDLR